MSDTRFMDFSKGSKPLRTISQNELRVIAYIHTYIQTYMTLQVAILFPFYFDRKLLRMWIISKNMAFLLYFIIYEYRI